jgi:ribosomal protein L7/L12
MSAANDASANEVLKVYRAATKTSLKEHQDAFDGAVSVYRARNQDAPEKVARRAVERIICNSL